MKRSTFCHTMASLMVMVSCGPSLRGAPYPPRGWRPDGPAFELPTEIEIKNPMEEVKTTLQSSGFQEYEAPTFHKEEQTNYLSMQQLPGHSPSQFYRQSEESEFKSLQINDIEAETEARESSTIEPEFKITTLIKEFANTSTEGYVIEKSIVFEDEHSLTTTEIGYMETISYDELEQIESDKSDWSTLNQNSKSSLGGEEEILILGTEKNTEAEESKKQERSTTNSGEETRALAEDLQTIDYTTELYLQTAALGEDEEILGNTTEFGNIEETTFAPIVVLDLEEQARNKEQARNVEQARNEKQARNEEQARNGEQARNEEQARNGEENSETLAQTQSSNNSEDFLPRISNGTLQGAVIQNKELWSIRSAESNSTQSTSASIKTLIAKSSSQKQQQKVASGTSETVDASNKIPTAGTTVLQTESQAELRDLDYTAPVGFAEYGTPFQQYGPPQSGARRLEVDSTTGYELSGITKILPADVSICRNCPPINYTSCICKSGWSRETELDRTIYESERLDTSRVACRWQRRGSFIDDPISVE